MTKLIRSIRPWKAVAMAAMVTVVAWPAHPVFAQNSMEELRLRKMEAEIRALQRKVFPGPEGRFFKPEIPEGTQQQPGQTVTGAPARSAVTDILTRMDAIEAELARLTGQVEENTNRIAKLEAAAKEAASKEAAAEAAPTAAPSSTPAAQPTSAPAANLAAMTGGASVAKPAPAVAPSDQRLKAVEAIVKPQTNDPGDDEYTYGYRLWSAKFYPEAEQELKLFIEKYPAHWRISYGRNLLGRAYLDDGHPREAAKWFLENYQADKTAARAPDSLLYLAVTMKDLKDTKRACIALAEFSQTYPGEAAGRLKGLYDTTRHGLKCG